MKKLLLITALVIVPKLLHAEEKEPFAILQLGGAAAWNLPGGSSFGPAASVEFQVTKNILVEPGLSPLFNNQGRVDWDFDVVVRRQFDLSETVEFEPGIGPAWGNSGFGATGSLEFMIWPWKDRKLGWFVDPTYTVSFTAGHQQSLGLNRVANRHSRQLGCLRLSVTPQLGALQPERGPGFAFVSGYHSAASSK